MIVKGLLIIICSTGNIAPGDVTWVNEISFKRE